MLQEYIKYHKKSVGLFFAFSFIFIIVFALYRLPAAAVLYGMAICLFVGGVVCGRDLISFRKRHQALQYLVEEIKVTSRHLPKVENLLEADYQEVLKALYDEKQQITNDMNHKYTDLVEYYTLWVHQIKTPISAMRLQLQGEDSDRSRELLEELQRIEQYVEMVLTYLRLDAGSTDYVLREYDLDDIIKQALRKHASQFIRKKIKLEYTPLNCKVLSDEKWLLFVIEQLLSNALKYTRSGSVSITLEAPKTLCIQDTGIGVAPEDLPRIFEKGFTGYNGRNDKKASGIGLYLCRRICDNLGHKIYAASEVDEGTLIRIDLSRDAMKFE
jgi:signal transduction histidine kinase